MGIGIILFVTLIIFFIKINAVSSIRYTVEKRLFIYFSIIILLEIIFILLVDLSVYNRLPLLYQKLLLTSKFITSVVLSFQIRRRLNLKENKTINWIVIVLGGIPILLIFINGLNIYHHVIAVIVSEVLWQLHKPHYSTFSNNASKLYTIMSIVDRIRYASFILIVYFLKEANIEGFYHVFIVNYAISIFSLLNEIDISKEVAMNTDLSNAISKSNPLFVLDSILSVDPSMILITDSRGIITYVNKAFVENTGYSLSELQGKNVKVLGSGNTKQEVYQSFREKIRIDNVWIGEFQNKKKNGDDYIDLTKIIRIVDANNRTKMYFSIKQDITFETKTMGELNFLANYDSMTGLLRRQKMDSLMNEKLDEFIKEHFNYYVAIVDIDKFKEINDEYGHLAGDEVIVDFAVKSRNTFRGNGFIGRFGGDEFLYFIYNISEQEVKELFKKLRIQTQMGVKRTKKRNRIDYTISIGLTKGSNDESLTDVIARADSLLYRSKGNSGNYLNYDF